MKSTVENRYDSRFAGADAMVTKSQRQDGILAGDPTEMSETVQQC
jgi:hypothetical protein